MIEGITGVALAGGKSRRMGRNKALLTFEGKTLVQRCAGTLSEMFSRVVISVNQQELFPDLHMPQIVDHYKETGPIGGITSVLESGETRIFCAACDMPFLNKNLIEYLCSFTDNEAVIPVWKGRPEVLHATYSDALLPRFQFALQQGKFRITDALAKAGIRYVEEEEIRKLDPSGLSFKNVNTPTDFIEITKP